MSMDAIDTRRRFLQGVLAAAGLAGLAGPARGGELPSRILPDPDLGRLRPVDPYVVGVRPYRLGGVRLEREAPFGGKQLVHNYGHAGAGITLSFGCAEAAADLVDEALAQIAAPRGSPGTGPPAPVAVIGTGVIGLTTASAIRRRRDRPVTIYARDLDLRSTTSFVAGGQFEPSGVWREHQDEAGRARLDSYLRRSRERIVALSSAWDRLGIAERDNYTLDHDIPALTNTPRDVLAGPRTAPLPFAKLNALGRVYRTWLLDPPRLLQALKAELEAAGVRFERRLFASKTDLLGLPEPVIVNCSGYGAKALVGDDKLVPQRGHLVMLERPTAAHDYFFSGGCDNGVTAYVFCRHDDIAIGGTVVAGDDRTEVLPEDREVFSRLMSNAGELFAGHPASCRG